MELLRRFTSISIVFQLAFILYRVIPVCIGGETCSISQGATTITAFCDSGCCSSQCCSNTSTAAISDVVIALCVILAIIIIALIIIVIIVSYRKKRPACCYKEAKDDEDKKKVLEERRGSSDAYVDDTDGKKKETTTDDPYSSGYSSMHSVQSDHSKKLANGGITTKTTSTTTTMVTAPIIGNAVAPPMGLPRVPPPVLSPNPFDSRFDKTEMLRLKKTGSQTGKTVTFNNRIESPRNSINTFSNANRLRTQYPPILPHLYRDETKDDKDLFSSSKNSPLKTPVHDRRHRKSFPTDSKNKIGLSPDKSPASARSNKQELMDSIFETDLLKAAKLHGRRHTDAQYTLKESEYSPTLVQAANSNNSVNSIVTEDDKAELVRNSGSASAKTNYGSPYKTTPLSTMFSKSKMLSTLSTDGTQRTKSNLGESTGPDGSPYFSSFMRRKSMGVVDDSPV